MNIAGMIRKRHPPVGARPGTLVIADDGQVPDIHVMTYSAEGLTEHEHLSATQLPGIHGPGTTTWIDVRGLADEPILRAIGEALSIHPLALEDVVNVPQRPKSEPYEEHQLVVLRMAVQEGQDIRMEQVTFLIGHDYVATFQERDGDVFDPVRHRIRQGRGLIRSAGAGYLGYALIDTVIDGFYPVLEHFGDHLAEIEEEVVDRPTRATLRRIYEAKRRLLDMRRGIWPHCDATSALVREESPFIDEAARVYLRDTYDHAMQLRDILEVYRETVSGLLDVYLSSESNRTNEVMRTLTVMASIFIPLTFIAGVYGMNFDQMPELHSRIGYPLVWAVMILVAAVLLWKFYSLGWIGQRDDD